MEAIETVGGMVSVDAVLETAHNEGRCALYEHEVYRILSLMAMAVPCHAFVRSEAEITRDVLSRFSSERIVLKAAAPGLVHKQKAGAVDVAVKDLDFVRYKFATMKHRLADQGHPIAGILLVSFVDYTRDLGNEVLLGFRESEAFGPVISFSKGGADAELFATCFSAPNIILAPIDRPWAEALLCSTRIYKKYMTDSRVDYVRKIVDAGISFSRLATAFSNFVATTTRFVIKAFEVNPFVFDRDGRFVALDGHAEFELRRSGTAPAASSPATAGMDVFFRPRGVAVIGVSSKGGPRPGNIIAKNLVKLGRSDVYGVNPKGGTLDLGGKSLPIHTTAADIEATIDLAVVAVPAGAAPAAMKACAEKGVRAVLLIPGGFSEAGKNEALEREIMAIARANGIRVMGPNCLGIIHSGDAGRPGLNTFFIPEEKFSVQLDKNQNVALLSQSGALGITEIYNLRHAISPRAIVSYGNQLDVDAGDLVRYFNRDPAVDVIGCYIEGFKPGQGRKFFETAKESRKPIIVYKAGRTEAGQQATQAHTASIAGEYEVARAAMKQAGLIVADTMIDHGDFIKTFALLNDFTVTGRRVAIIANAGYEKTYAADNLGGLQLATFDARTTAALEKILPPFVGVDPLLDLTPMAGDELYEQCLDIILSSDQVDAVFVSIVPQGGAIHTTDSEIERHRDNVAARIVRRVHQHQKPVAVSVCVTSGADAVYNRFGQVLDAGGVPTFLTANRAMVCLNEFIRYRLTAEDGNYCEWLK